MAASVCWIDASGRLRCRRQRTGFRDNTSPAAAIEQLRAFPEGSARQALAIELVALLSESTTEPSAEVSEAVLGAAAALLVDPATTSPIRLVQFLTEIDLGDAATQPSPSSPAAA
jgi:hypothetical protein